MGYEAILSITYKSASDNSILDVIEILVKSNWNLFNNNGYIEYLPLGDNDDFDWQSEMISSEKLKEIINSKLKFHEKIGINLYHSEMKCGITVLSHSDNDILFNLDIDRRTTTNNLTDIGWYYNSIILPLTNNGYLLTHICFEEYIS